MTAAPTGHGPDAQPRADEQDGDGRSTARRRVRGPSPKSTRAASTTASEQRTGGQPRPVSPVRRHPRLQREQVGEQPREALSARLPLNAQRPTSAAATASDGGTRYRAPRVAVLDEELSSAARRLRCRARTRIQNHERGELEARPQIGARATRGSQPLRPRRSSASRPRRARPRRPRRASGRSPRGATTVSRSRR